MNYQKILLALRDGEELGIFTGFLAEQGFEVAVATDGATALELAIGTHPALVITDPELPVISGERIFQIIRHNPNTSRIPFLFISDSVSDIKGFHTGVDVFLLRPLNLDEVRARVARTLRSDSLPAPESTDMEGRLSHISIADILQFMQLNSKEGELLVTSGAIVGKIYVKDGQVYNSVAGGVEKEKALFRLLTLDEGKFEFIPRQISISRKIKGSTGSILMEGMRQLDEYRKNRDKLPDPELAVEQAPGTADLAGDLAKPVYGELMKLTAQYNTVADLIEHCSWPDYETHSALSALLARGVLRRRSHGDGHAASGPVIRAVDSDGELVVAGALAQRPVTGGHASVAASDAADYDAEFLTTDQAISIREKIITRFADTMNLTFARILIAGTGGAAVATFLRSLRRIGGVRINHRAASLDSHSPVPVGEVATYRLYGGMDLVFVSVPSVRHMGPVYTAFSTNLVGVILLFDDAGARELKGLSEARRELSTGLTVPLAHIFLGASPGDDDTSFFKKTLDLRADEPLFTLSGNDRGCAREAVYSIFSKLLKEEVFLAS